MISRAIQAVWEQRARAGTRPATPDAATSAVPETLSGERRDRRGGAERALRSSRKALPGAFGRQEVSIRILDIAASVALLGAAGPLLLMAALLVKLTSPGPVIYRQQRVGRQHRIFTLYKLRTMTNGAERDTGPVWAVAQNPRITPVGRLLRSTRIDELPQLFNVLRGDMSLVGPRPERPWFVARFEVLQGLRLAVKPGITGLAQIRGRYDLSPEQKVRYDTLYVRQRSVRLNAFILVQTIPVVLLRRGWR